MMVNIFRYCVSVVAAGLLVLGFSGCQKSEDSAEDSPARKGTAERVGENFDQAAAEAAKHLNKLAEDAGKGLEKAGESLQKEAKGAQEKDPPAADARPKEKEEQK
jgi:hypothetical protein